MARSRNIKPGFYKNADLAECSVWARLIFPGLWMLADREGRLEDRPKQIKGELIPFDAQDIEPLLAELATRKFIVRYQNSEGSFIQISKFSTHQTPHYSEKKSVIKGPSLQEKHTHEAPPTPRNSGDEGSRTPGTFLGDSKKSPLIKRGSQPPDSLIPDTRILTADSPNPESGEKQHPPPGLPPVARKRGNGQDQSPKTALTWEAYADAYAIRWKAEPVRNATVNAQLGQVVKRLGLAEAPAVSAFYVRSNRGLYVSAKHPVNLLLRDCEALRTEWATGHQGTDTEARQADRTAATGNAFSKLIEEAG